MKVKELIDQLSKIDPETPVIGYTQDAEVLGPGLKLRVFEVEQATTLIGEKTRLEDGTPYVKLHHGAGSSNIAAIMLSAEC